MADRYSVRRASKGDIPVLVRHRIEMFRAMRPLKDRDAVVIAATFRRHLARALPRGEYLGWVAEHGGKVVAGAGVVPRPLLPRPWSPRGGFEAYVLNVFTEPEHRGRGLARRLMREVLAWARREGAALVSLHASDMARPIYEGLGFKEGREMRLVMKKRR
jgi:GNAT superfamily N-acetyltransferase